MRTRGASPSASEVSDMPALGDAPGLTWTSGVGLRRTSCDSNLSLRQHGPVSPAEVQAVCSRLNLPVLRVLQALVKGFHPNTAADSSRQSFKTLLVSRCCFRLKHSACSLTACGVECLNAHSHSLLR